MLVSGRQHSADDIIATVLAVEPMKFIYRGKSRFFFLPLPVLSTFSFHCGFKTFLGRISVFSVNVLRDERICIIAEQKPNVAEEDSFDVRFFYFLSFKHLFIDQTSYTVYFSVDEQGSSSN